MQQFLITLKNEKRKFYNRFALLLFSLNGIGSVIVLLYADKPVIGKIYDLGLLIASIAATITCILIATGRLKTIIPAFNIAAVVILAFWIAIGYWWIGLLVTVLVLLYRNSQKELVVAVNNEMVLYPSFPIKKISWGDLNNLILKDGLLTIDLKSNKIIQQMIDPDKTSIDEKEFNEFCNKQLRSGKPGDPKPDYGGAIEGLGEIISSVN